MMSTSHIQRWNRLLAPVMRQFRSSRGLLLRQVFPDIASYRVCDLGGSRHFWNTANVPVDPRRLTIYNIAYGDSGSLATTGRYDTTPIVPYDGKRIPAPDQHFDVLICNSVIEHVAPDDRKRLVAEMKRVATHVVIQTPAKSFPVDPHLILPFVQWMPKPLARLAAQISPWRVLSRPSHSTIRSYVDQTNLLNRRDIQQLMPEARIYAERFVGLTKSYIAVA